MLKLFFCLLILQKKVSGKKKVSTKTSRAKAAAERRLEEQHKEELLRVNKENTLLAEQLKRQIAGPAPAAQAGAATGSKPSRKTSVADADETTPAARSSATISRTRPASGKSAPNSVTSPANTSLTPAVLTHARWVNGVACNCR